MLKNQPSGLSKSFWTIGLFMTGINTLPRIIWVTTVLLESSTRKSAESGNTALDFKLFAVLKVLQNYMNEYIKKHADSSKSLFIVCFKKNPKQANFENNPS